MTPDAPLSEDVAAEYCERLGQLTEWIHRIPLAKAMLASHRAMASRVKELERINFDHALGSAAAVSRIAELEKENDSLRHSWSRETDEGIAMTKALSDAQAQLAVAERALLDNGYRKDCDIQACNCGAQWNHGGHANERLREVSDALPYENGKSILRRVESLVEQHATLTARCQTMEKALQEALKIMPLMIERSWAEASIDTGQATWADVRHLREQATGIESQIKHALSTGGEIGGNNGNAK